MTKALHVVVLAAGQGKRMYSNLPKVLHQLAGKALLHHVLDTAQSLEPEQIHVVYGHGGEQVKSACTEFKVEWVHQAEQKGTGHAVGLAIKNIPDEARVLILYGDVPLLGKETLLSLLDSTKELCILTAELDNPFGYGRIIREGNQIIGIVEQKDASESEQLINEINSGIMLADVDKLKALLLQVDSNNSQGELYLTDVVGIANNSGVTVDSSIVQNVDEIMGVNNKGQLHDLERKYQLKIARGLLEQGVHLYDAARIDIRGSLSCGKNVSIDINCVFEGNISLGDDVVVSANCFISNSHVSNGVTIKPNSIIEDSEIGESSIVGPYARLRPGAKLSKEVHIGNFVEVKNSNINDGSKVNHLSYVGDSDVGSSVNIGAGTITCNYDGANKHRTVIGDNVFIGSGTELIAPVKVGNGATTGAGSSISKDVPAGHLDVTRSKQISIANWQRPKKKGM